MKLLALTFYLFLVCSLPVFSQTDGRKIVIDGDTSIYKGSNYGRWGLTRFLASTAKTRFDNTEIDKFLKQYPKFLVFKQVIQVFYSQRKMAYAWFDQKGLIEQADNLFNRIVNLEPKDLEQIPYLKALDSLMNLNSTLKISGKYKIKLELLLTAHYFALAETSNSKNYPATLKDLNWKLSGQKVAYVDYLDDILNSETRQTSIAQSPINRQFELLKMYLGKYSDLDKKGNYFKINLDKTSYKLGDTSEVINQIKLRLIDLADLEDKNPNDIFNLQLEQAVKHFQSRHGLLDDGIIGKGTVAELNVTFRQRIKQLIVNMERCRWVPENISTDYVAVNIPEFKLHVFSNNQLLWSCKVVVGKVMNKTVVFNADLKYVVFSPYWNVPQSIVRNEILKDMRRDRNYLNRHQMEITAYRNGLPEIRQKPGPLNALGKVKFIFPNSYNIFLHDTPSKSLFNEPIRAFSHGCIRVSEPFKLAQFLLRNQPEWDDAAILAAMDLGKEKHVSLTDKVSVFIVYFTSFVDSEGKINFRKDIYGRDERMAEMIIDF